MISGVLKRTNFFHYDEVVNEDKKEFEKKKQVLFFIFSLDVFCFYQLGIGGGGGGVILTLKVSIGGGFALMLRDSNVHDVDVVQKDVVV